MQTGVKTGYPKLKEGDAAFMPQDTILPCWQSANHSGSPRTRIVGQMASVDRGGWSIPDIINNIHISVFLLPRFKFAVSYGYC